MKKLIVILMIATLSALGVYDYFLSKRIQELEYQQMLFKNQEKNCIKEALWHEARNQGYDGLVAVLSVIDNRKNHPNYPGTYCLVINQYKQFSYKQKGSGEYLDQVVNDRERPVLEAIDALAQEAVDGNFQVALPREVLWYTTKSVSNYWTRTMKKFKKVKDHVFYYKSS